MNCNQCGAPQDWDGARPIVVCDYCNSIRSVCDIEVSVDRIGLTGQPGDANCPRCQHQMTAAAMDGMKVDHCEECRGVLIRRDLFAILVRNRRAAFRGAAERAVPLDPKQLKIVVDCPECQRAMEVHPYYGPGNIVIDSCRVCGLIWLDSGEMATIEVAPGRR